MAVIIFKHMQHFVSVKEKECLRHAIGFKDYSEFNCKKGKFYENFCNHISVFCMEIVMSKKCMNCHILNPQIEAHLYCLKSILLLNLASEIRTF